MGGAPTQNGGKKGTKYIYTNNVNRPDEWFLFSLFPGVIRRPIQHVNIPFFFKLSYELIIIKKRK